jgi:hypothetical protein
MRRGEQLLHPQAPPPPPVLRSGGMTMGRTARRQRLRGRRRWQRLTSRGTHCWQPRQLRVRAGGLVPLPGQRRLRG